MDCIECKTTNPETNRYCGHCGAELGRSLPATILRDGLRDRRVIEVEITEAVATRLRGWVILLLGAASVILILVLGNGYYSVHTAVVAGTSQINAEVQRGQADIDRVTTAIPGLQTQVDQIQSDLDKYKLVNEKIATLQKDITRVQRQVVDLGKRDLKANSVESTGPGPGYFSLGGLACPSSVKQGFDLDYCAKGSPPVLYQLTSTGDLKPVSSRSPVGFQDISKATKPTCDSASRGTVYVEKGTERMADEPFLCAKQSDNTYDWIKLVSVP
jgi:hypothetical protein